MSNLKCLNMKKIFTILLVVCMNIVVAQQQSNKQNQFEQFDVTNTSDFDRIKLETINIGNAKIIQQNKFAEVITKPFAISLTEVNPFLSISCGFNEMNNKLENNTSLEIRFSTDGLNWNNWQNLLIDEHSSNSKFQFVTQLLFTEKEVTFYQMKITTNLLQRGALVKDVFLNLFNPSNAIKTGSNSNLNNANNLANRTTACPCPQPSFTNRVGWGCPQGATSPSYTTVTHLIVHHSAGSNTSANWPSVVLSVWNSHVNTNGWADIGYNWLIDPNGQLYEGRGGGNNVVGAHFCGFNAGTMGTCMLGTFTSVNVTDTARKKLVEILAWKCCNSSLSPTASAFHASSNLTINRISGHRDGCATECPGNMLYASLPGIRTEVNTFINNVCNVTSLPIISGVESLQVTPNPTNGKFTISIKLATNKTFRYSLYNADGKNMYTSSTKQTGLLFTENVTQLEKLLAGTYIIKIFLDKNDITKTIIKQ